MYQYSKSILLSLIILFSVSKPTFSKPSQATGDELPAFVQNHLQLSAANYSAYQNKMNSKAGGAFVSMGNDPNCSVDINIANIQQVIDSGATEIRLADNASYNEDIFISNKSIIIRGGFNDCADANNNVQQPSKTLITGTGTDPVISISGSNNTYSIELQNLDIRNGLGSDFFPGGGISTLGSNSNITLDNVYVANNNGNLGGGIAINGGETDLTIIDTIVQFNQAISGGGIYCNSPDASIAIFDASGIIENTATGQVSTDGGGGMYLTNGCIASVFSGSSALSNQLGISGNISESNGGGVYLNEGAKLNLYGQRFCFMGVCFGDSSEPINITNNQAHDHSVYEDYGNGGGIYAYSYNTGTEVYMQGVLINNNLADIRGGGLYAIGANVEIERSSQSCWDKNRCNYFQGNEASNPKNDDTFGGALYLYANVNNIKHTVFEDNRADFGTAIHLDFSTANVSGSVFNNNGNSGQGTLADQYVISLQDLSELTVEHVTIADNEVQNATIGRSNGNPVTVNVYSSIIYNPNTGPVFDAFAGFTADIDCVIAHEIASMQTFSGSHLLNNNPKFKAPLDRDYHLDAMLSPAVDFCAQSDVLGNLKDMDGQVRGWDDGSIPNDQNNINNIYDAGADETYDNDIIFVNGFES